MPIEILMPALSPTMEEGKLAKWLVGEGQKVKPGDVIAEIETDKATMEVEAVDEGTLAKILVSSGTDNVKVNTPIAVLLGDGEDSASLTAAAKAPPPASPAAKVAATPAAAPAAPEPARPAATPTAKTAPPAPARGNGHADGRIFASPLARRLARERGIDLAALAGSGPHGRIIKRDVEGARPGAALAATPGTAVVPTPPQALKPMADDQILSLYDKGSYEVVPHDGMRKTIARRLTESKQTIPHFYLTVDCRLDDLLAARGRLNAASPKEGPRAYKLSVNDFVIKALALALQEVPAANATWTEQGMLRHKSSDVGVAVAVDGGLFTPVIRHAEVKSLSEISNEMRDLADRARRKRLAPHEYQGGTTSISNLGMYGIRRFDAVINPPHASILAVGAGERRPVIADDGSVVAATMMSCTISCDHRVIDGAVGAMLINAFKAFMEDPVRMLV
ncbi:MAG: pyruvate dehydrogenase complex dihydrolipoamide acetyltransferase [Hyphomicrobiaceae bacterium]